MSYAILRVRKLNSFAAIRSAEIHNDRRYDQLGLKKPPNIQNTKYSDCNHHMLLMKGNSMEDAIKNRLKDLGIKPRSNAVLAHEYVLAVSNNWYEKANYSSSGMLSNLSRFIDDLYGSENVVTESYHYDEHNPHVHLVVMPIVEKERRWKNRNGEGAKKSYNLSGDDFVSGKESLTKLQDDFHAHAKKWQLIEAPIIRGLRATMRKKIYQKKTNYQIGKLKDVQEEIKSILKEMKESGKESHEQLSQVLLLKYEEKELLSNEFSVDNTELLKSEKEEARRKRLNEGDGWKKELRFFDDEFDSDNFR